jgi:dienelactone hydrolase
MSSGRRLWRRALEIVAWMVLIPAIVISLTNAELFRLVVGAFGPPPDAGMIRLLLLGTVLAALAFWRARRAGASERAMAMRSAGLASAALITILVIAARSRDVRRHDVAFDGNGIRIGATIYEPLTDGPHPAVVFVPGSAPFKRGLYALWAEHLARVGVMSIVPDKRGVGGTDGAFERNNNSSRANLELLAGDAVAALDYAAKLPNVDATRLGLFGVSQGGWVAPIAAVSSDRARFIIMVTGPTVSVREEGMWSDLRGDDQRAAQMSRAQAEQVMDTVTPGGVDARPFLTALKIPGLWLFGSDDASIPTRRSVMVLDSTARGLNKRFSFDSAPGYGHLVMGRPNGFIPRVAPSSWRAMDSWIERELLLPGRRGS